MRKDKFTQADFDNALKEHDKHVAALYEKGIGTGATSRIMSVLCMFVFVALFAIMIQKGMYLLSVSVLLIFLIKKLSGILWVGLIICFIFTGNWIELIMVVLYIIFFSLSFYYGQNHINTKYLTATHNVDPLEGTADILFATYLEWISIFLGIILSGYISLAFWILLIIAVLYHANKLYFRLSTGWRRLHYSIMVRYAAIIGYDAQINNQSKSGLNILLIQLAKNVYPNWDDNKIKEYVNTHVFIQAKTFNDKKDIVSTLQAKGSIDISKLEAFMDSFTVRLSNNEIFLMVALFIASVVEISYGKEERIKYLIAIMDGNAF